MVADEPIINNEPEFTVENNIYKGRQTTYTGYKGVGEMIWNSIQKHGNNIAQVDARTDEVVTFAELHRKTIQCALWLQKQGIKYGDVISVCTHNQVNCFVPCLAAAYINVIFSTWDDDMDLQTAMHFVQLSTPKVIFCNEKSVGVILAALKKADYDTKIVIFGDYPDLISFSEILTDCNESEIQNFRYVEVNNIKDMFCILHSSGTTGMPKGIALSNYGMLSTLQATIFELSGVVSLWFSSLYWVSGVILSLITIREGCKIIIYPEFDEEMTCKLIDKYQITWVFAGTSMVNRFLKAGYVKNYSLSSLKLIVSGGAILDKASQDELKRVLPHVNVLQAYGMTEFTGLVTSQNPNHKNGSCGIVAQNVQMKIIDPESGKILGPNQPGEVCAKAETVMMGYYRNPEATKETIDDEGWLHTGDLGYFDEDGELFIIDRLKQLIKYRGHHVSPSEIESLLLTHPAVLEVGVVGVPHPTDDEHPIAYISKKPGFKVKEQELLNLVANNMIDRNQLRAGVVFIDIFPYTASGKISKKELKAMAKKGTAAKL